MLPFNAFTKFIQISRALIKQPMKYQIYNMFSGERNTFKYKGKLAKIATP